MKIATQKQNASAIAEHFVLHHPVDSVEPFGRGLINDTFLVAASGSRYILQRINDRVFPAPERILSNLAVLEQHLASQSNAGLRIPALVRSHDGLPFSRGPDGAVWRLMEFIPNTDIRRQIDNPAQAKEVGRILGRFHYLTNGLDANRLTATLPGFHVTPNYLDKFQQIIRGSTTAPSDSIRQAIAFVNARRDDAAVLEEAQHGGRIPVRVVHGDPKLDNILFDRSTGQAISLIDLDTVQPGLLHYDLGDCLRSCCNRVGESTDGSACARFDLGICHAILGTYATETKGVLNDSEIELLYDAIRLLPFELGLRFLTDHLEGNRHFRVTVPGQNLSKSQVQFALVEDIEGKEAEIRQTVAECFGSDI